MTTNLTGKLTSLKFQLDGFLEGCLPKYFFLFSTRKTTHIKIENIHICKCNIILYIYYITIITSTKIDLENV